MISLKRSSLHYFFHACLPVLTDVWLSAPFGPKERIKVNNTAAGVLGTDTVHAGIASCSVACFVFSSGFCSPRPPSHPFVQRLPAATSSSFHCKALKVPLDHNSVHRVFDISVALFCMFALQQNKKKSFILLNNCDNKFKSRSYWPNSHTYRPSLVTHKWFASCYGLWKNILNGV